MSKGFESGHRRVLRGLVLFCVWMVVVMVAIDSATHAADSPSIKIATDADELFIGESLTLQVIVQGVETPSPPDMRGLEEDFQYELLATQPMSSSSVVIINGRMTSQQEFKTIFQYRLTPKRSGRLVIPSLKTVAEAHEITSSSLVVNVIEPEPQEYVIAEVEASPDSVYPTQTFEVTMRVFVRSLPDSERDPLTPLRRDPPSLTIPWIEASDGLRGPEDLSKWLSRLRAGRDYGFSINGYRSNDPFDFGFGRPRLALFDLANGVVDRELSDGSSARFSRYELTMKFQATRAGQFTFGPAAVRGTFVTDSDGREYRGQKIAVNAQPIRVTVKEVPEDRPEQFMGGIGRFQVQASVSPSRVRVGDPMTLTLDFSGETPDALALVAAPDLRRFESISNDFEIMDHAPVGRMEGSHKLFTYGIRPKTKRQEIPSLTFHSFDPNTEQFIELETNSISIEMQEASSLSTSEIVGPNRESRSGLKADRTGIFQGTAEMYPLTDDEVLVSRWVSVVGLAWLLSLTGAWAVKIRSRQGSTSSVQRLMHARTVARQRLAAAQQSVGQGQMQQGRMELRQALVGLVAAAANQPSEGFTTQNVLDYLSRTPLESTNFVRIRELLESFDASLYGGASEEDMRSMLESADALVDPLVRVLKQRLNSDSPSGSTAKARSMVLLTMFGCFPPFQALAQETVAPNRPLQERTQPTTSSPLPRLGANARNQLFSEEIQEVFLSATQLMETAQTTEQFVEAAQRLDELESLGIKSGSLHFHAGNAWFRAGQIGRSIRHYRLAKFYLPRDGYLQSNLEQALAMARSGPIDSASFHWMDKILFWSQWISFGNKIRVSAVLMLSGAILFFCSVWRKDRRFMGMTALIVLLSVVIYLEARQNSPARYASRKGVVCQQTVARKGMGNEYAPAFDRPLQDGAEFEVLQRTSQWTLGRFPGVGDGWIHNDSIVQATF